MSSFTTPLEVEFIDGHRWKVLKPFIYHLGALDSPDFIEVPVGFETDFASVPRGLWNFFPPTGPYGKAAVIHDWLYQGGHIVSEFTYTPDEGGATTIRQMHHMPDGRHFADAILWEAMGVLGVPLWKRVVIYWGVRIGGGIPWMNGHKEKVNGNG
jgi:hypothetical protein